MHFFKQKINKLNIYYYKTIYQKDSIFGYYTVYYLALFWVGNYGKNENKKIIKSVNFTVFNFKDLGLTIKLTLFIFDAGE